MTQPGLVAFISLLFMYKIDSNYAITKVIVDPITVVADFWYNSGWPEVTLEMQTFLL